MLATLRKRFDRDDEGFTLIELMVVVLIIAILLAIAIPTFLGAQDRARDRAAQSNLRNGITAAKTIATDSDGFFLNSTTGAIVDATDLDGVEGSLTWVQGAADGTDATGSVYVASVTATTGAEIVLQAKSGSNAYFCMKATSDGDVTYGKSDTGTAATDAAATDGDTAGECSAAKF
jgi:type IV pilus assembly protein PilA